MAGGTQPYVIRGGDYLTAIAYSRGLKPDDIWNEPGNDDLRKKRQNPDMLVPGDVLQIPVVKPKWMPLAIGSNNKFVASPPVVTIQLTLYQDDDGKNALSGLTYSIEGTTEGTTTGTLGDDGAIEFEVAVCTRQVALTLVELGQVYPLMIGGIDPVDATSGTRQRLANLGYLDDHGGSQPIDQALALFQSDQQIDATGTCDDATAKALVGEHGS